MPSSLPRTRLQEVELRLDTLLESAEPEGEPAKLRYYADRGNSAAALGENMAWRTIHDMVLRLRENMVSDLVDGKDGAAESRKAIRTIDSILKMPELFLRDGHEAQKILKQSGRTDE